MCSSSGSIASHQSMKTSSPESTPGECRGITLYLAKYQKGRNSSHVEVLI